MSKTDVGVILPIAKSLMQHLASPMAAEVLRLLDVGDYAGLALLRVDPSHYTDPFVFRRDYQAVSFLRKSVLLPLSPKARREAAEKVFEECEMTCAETNHTLRTLRLLTETNTGLARYGVEGHANFLQRVQKLLGRILGPVPPSIQGRFGPGSTHELSAASTKTVLDKLSNTHVTEKCAPIFDLIVKDTLWGAMLGNGLPLPHVSRGNKFTVVPKDATKDRGICSEPGGNLYCQLGVGGYLKRRLAMVGLHVDRNNESTIPPHVWRIGSFTDGAETHRRLAREGSATGKWATIDLSNASDTIAYELVKWCYPPDWFAVLDAVRSPTTRFKKRVVYLDKFSSMGNGATFELETGLFAALVAVSCGLKVGEDLFVYGDDIVLPDECYSTARGCLETFGFTPNEKKCFHGDSPFRESCGGDYFFGVDVTPVYSKSDMSTPLDWIVLHNAIKKAWPNATQALQRCVEAVPSHFACYGPLRLGDLVFHGPPERWKVVEKDGISWINGLKPVDLPSYPLERWSSAVHLLGVLSGSVRSRKVSTRKGGYAFRDDVLIRGNPGAYKLARYSIS